MQSIKAGRGIPEPWTVHSGSVVRRLFWLCLSIELLLVMLDLGLNYAELIPSRSLQRIFNLAHEQSLGTWFSVVQMALIGIVLLLLGASVSKSGKRVVGLVWGLFGSFFLFLSADDAAKIHERVGGYVDKLISESSEPVAALEWMHAYFPSYAWQWVVGPFFAVVGLALLYFVWARLTSGRTRLLFLAAFACWGVAVLLDFIEGIDGLFEGWAEQLAVKNYTVSHPILMIEEFLEMLGGTLFLCVFVDCLLRELADRQVTIGFLPDTSTAHETLPTK